MKIGAQPGMAVPQRGKCRAEARRYAPEEKRDFSA